MACHKHRAMVNLVVSTHIADGWHPGMQTLIGETHELPKARLKAKWKPAAQRQDIANVEGFLVELSRAGLQQKLVFSGLIVNLLLETLLLSRVVA